MIFLIVMPLVIAAILGVMWLVKGKDWKAKQRDYPRPEDHKPGKFG